MKETVKEYYGKTIQTTKDLKTSACCVSDSMPSHMRGVLREIEPEILDKFYGCGSPIPHDIDKCVVLDLGCGTGRDVYIASKLVGEKGEVIGVDMTDEQLEVALKHIDAHTKKFGFANPNVKFKKGYIEDLGALGIADNSVDVVISNCVINLSPDKESVFAEIFRVLKPGGELYFSDVFSGRRIPKELQKDPVLVGECLGGALYIEDFRRILRSLGCLDYRIVSKRKLTLDDPEIKKKAGTIDFYSMNIRAFKLDALEDACEDYGHTVKYLGTIPNNEDRFKLDERYTFNTGEPLKVCGNTALMLQKSRYAKHFEVTGDMSVHYGPFSCGCSDNASKNKAFKPVTSCC